MKYPALSRWLAPCSAAFLLSVNPVALAQSPNADFNVAVNAGPTAPNAGTVYPGEATSLRVTLSNNSTTSALTGVNFDKALPAGPVNGLVVHGPAVISGDAGCTGGTLSTVIGASGIALSGLTVPARVAGLAGSGECYVDIPVVGYSVDGASTSLAYSLHPGEADSDQGVNITGGSQAVTLRFARRPSWNKSFVGSDIAVIGGPSRLLRFTLTNNDPNISLNNVGFVDLFPTAGAEGAHMEPTGAAAGGNCGGATTLTQGAAAQIEVTGVSLAPNSSCNIDVPVRARHTNGAYTLTLTNSVSASTFSSREGLAPSGDASQRMRSRSPLSVSKNFSPTTVASGEENTFTIILRNSGSTPLPVTNFVDNPIAAAPYAGNLMIAAASDVANSCSGGSAALENGGEGFSVSGFTIPANGNCRITVTYTGTTPSADTPTTYTNRLPLGAVQTSVPGIVSQTRSATVLVADRLRVLKRVSPANAAPGDPVNYTVTVQNFATSAIADVDVSDSLENGSTLLLGSSFAPTVTSGCGSLDLNGAATGDTSVTFSIGNLPGRSAASNTPGSCTISFWAMLDPDGSGRTENRIDSGAVCYGTTTRICNNVGAPSTRVNPLDTMSVEKRFDDADMRTLNEGTPARLSFTVANRSISPLSSLTLSDTLPSDGPYQQLRIASPANVSNSCGGNVTALPDANTIVLNGGSVAALQGTTPGSCTLSVDVVGPAGSYLNTVNASAVRANADGTTSTLLESDTATLIYTDVLAASKRFIPDAVGSGGRSTVSIELASADASRPITGIGFTDDLPAGMVVADPANAYATCDGAPDITAAAGATSVALAGAVLAPQASCELRFDVIATGSADWENVIPAGGITADGGLLNRNPVTATLVYTAPESPLISKTLLPATVVPGESALLTISITNAGQDLTNLAVTDYFTRDGTVGTLPNGMRIAPAPEALTNCESGIVTAIAGGNSVALSGASLAANASCEVQVRVTSTTAGAATNTIPVNSITADQGVTNTSSFAQSTLITTSEIGVSKAFDPAVVGPNEPSTLRVSIFNARSEAVTAMELTDVFPAGLSVAPQPNSFSNCGGGVVVEFPDTGTLKLTDASIGPAQGDAAASCYVEVDVVSVSEDSYLNVIAADSLISNGVIVPHPEASARLEVRQRLIVNKAFDNLTLDAGDPNGFSTGVAARLPGVDAPLSIRLENPNTGTLTEVSLTDALPDGLVLADDPSLSTTCTDGIVTGVAAGRELRLTGATLAPAGEAGAVCTVTAQVVSNIPGSYTNEIAAGDVTSFEGIDNQPATQARIVVAEPPAVTKAFTPPVVAPNVPAVLSIVLNNDNAATMTLTEDLVDSLPADPAQMVVANPAGVTTTCPGGVAVVAASAGDTAVTIASGTEVPSGGCTVSVNVSAPAAGDYLNHIAAGALVSDFGTNLAAATATLKVSTLGYVAGRVFLDQQQVADGTYIAGQSTPVPGNVIELRQGPDCSAALLDSAPTDAQGSYLFSELAAGTYSVCQPSQPDATLNSVTTAGTIEPVPGMQGSPGTAGVASNPDASSSQIIGIVLEDSGQPDEVSGSPENNFSEVLPVSVSGFVYHDVDGDGVHAQADAGIAGVTVSLSGPEAHSAVTGADGGYRFEGLFPGEYTVTESQPDDWTDAEDTAGTVDGDSRGDASVNDVISGISLAPGEDSIGNNFGESLVGMVLQIAGRSYCQQDAAHLEYQLLNYAGSDVTVELLTTSGRVVERMHGQAAGATLLWPGMVVDDAGNGVGWPGWLVQGDEWVQVGDDRVPQLTLRLSVGTGAQVEQVLNYPQASSACMTRPPGTLPAAPQPPSPGSGGAQPIPAFPAGMLWAMMALLALAGSRRLK